MTYSPTPAPVPDSVPIAPAQPGAAEGRITPLDGVRAVAILAIMAYHSGVPAIDVGGYFSQDAFFVLSGLLITLILLRQREGTGRIRLGVFYAGRIRRLLPALFVMLIGVTLFVDFVAPPGQYPGYRQDALSVLGYFSNWHFIATDTNYFALSAAPSMLTHTWSLAIEEQFYVVWPLVLMAILWLTRHHRQLGLRVVFAASTGGAFLSGAWMAHLYRSGATTARLYFGTDSHAQSILVGCALAAVLAMVNQRRRNDSLVPVARSVAARRILSGAGVGAALALGWQWTHVGSGGRFIYEGGFLVGALLTAVVLASVSCAPKGPLATVLSWPVLTYLGTISYGMYLWYFPVFQVVDEARTHRTGLALFAIRLAVDIAIATVSYFLIEQPIRRGSLFRSSGVAWVPRLRPLGLLASSSVLTLAVVVGTTAGSSASFALPVSSARSSPPLFPAPTRGAEVTRLLVVGDSTALTLGDALPTTGAGWDAAIDEQGTIGCGVAIGPLVMDHGVAGAPGAPCDSATPASEQWPARLQGLVASDHPDVVALLAGRWEVTDRVYDGQWTNILAPAFQQYVRDQLRLAVEIGTASGAHMVLLTAPCYSSGEQPDGSPWPEDSPARVQAYNEQLYLVADEFPNRASVVNLNAMLCPGGRFASVIDGVTVRAPDGVHFPYFQFGSPLAEAPDDLAQVDAFAAWIGPKLMPLLVAAANTSSD